MKLVREIDELGSRDALWSAMMTSDALHNALTQEIDESCVVAVGRGQPTAECQFTVSFQETAGYKLDIRDKMLGRWRADRRCKDTVSAELFVVATDTESAMVKLAQEIDEWASYVVFSAWCPTAFLSPLWLRALALPRVKLLVEVLVV